MNWKTPPLVKVYEALGAIADGRVAITDDGATVTSSSGNKLYSVVYDEAANTIASNDNGSHYQGYLGYPAVAYLMKTGLLPYNPSHARALQGIAWKDVAQQASNDWNIVERRAEDTAQLNGVKADELREAARQTLIDIRSLDLARSTNMPRPPKGY